MTRSWVEAGIPVLCVRVLEEVVLALELAAADEAAIEPAIEFSIELGKKAGSSSPLPVIVSVD
jgi:hypothetical protein